MIYAKVILTGYLAWLMVNEYYKLGTDKHGEYTGETPKKIGAFIGIFLRHVTIFALLWFGGYYIGVGG